MISAFDRLVIDVPGLEPARSSYNCLLGDFDPNGVLTLGNLQVVLRASAGVTKPRIASLGLLDPDLGRGEAMELTPTGPGYRLQRSHHREDGYAETPTATGIYAVDHVVLQTRDADTCIRRFRDELGLRLALDKTVPEFGGRMLFFRLGKMTLEVIQHLEDIPHEDVLWGITYLCRDIEATVAELDRRGVAHSPVRSGRKPGTRVATVKSHCLDLPTLLIGPG
jgi:hypothetical protein